MHKRRHLYQSVIYGGATAPLSYTQQVLNLFGSDIISYLTLSDSSGTMAADASGNNRTGTYTNSPTLGAEGIGDGLTSVSFDGTDDLVNWYSASLAAAFNSAEGTFMQWLKLSNGVWNDGVYRKSAQI